MSPTISADQGECRPNRWRELPVARPRVPGAAVERVLLPLLLVAVAGLPALARAGLSPDGPGRRPAQALVLVASAAAVAAVRTRRGWWWALTGAAVVAAAAVDARILSVSVAVGAATVWAVGGGRHEGAGARGGSRDVGLAEVGPLLGVAVVAAFAAGDLERPSTMLLVQALGLVLVGSPVLRRGLAALGRVVERAVLWFVGAVGTTVVAALGLLVVVLPWAFERVLGWDPLWAPRSGGSRFVPRHVQQTDPRRTWLPRTSMLPTGRGRAVRLLPRLGVVAIVVVLLMPTFAEMGGRLAVGDPAAMASSPWWADAHTAEAAAFENATYEAFLGVRLADLSSPYVNVVGGRRVTWQPPTDPALRVWFFGGSTMFGLGQRDGATIPSQFAREAWERGLPLAVTNFGVHADVHWMEHRRLQDALASGEPPPDLVVFYDGWNDYDSHGRRRPGEGEVTFRGTLDNLHGGGDVPGPPVVLRPLLGGYELKRRPEAPEPDGETSYRESLVQYRESVAASRRDLAALGIEAAYVVQPMRASRSEPVGGEGPDAPERRSTYRRFVRSRPPGVVDLSAVMDGVRAPVYYDEGHTNEEGAAVISAALVDELWPTLERLSGEVR